MDNHANAAEVLKTLGNPTRIDIVKALLHGEVCVSELQHRLGIPQSTVSQHLRLLRDRGIVRERQDGTRRCYRLVSEQVRRVMASVGE